MLLAWDTSTDVVTVALHDGDRVVGHRVGSGTRRHAEVLTPLVSGLLAEAGVRGTDLDRICAGVGPGAYTGLRVGLVTAQALGVTWGAPVIGACSLDALAAQVALGADAPPADGFLVVSDARRHQVFWARYDARGRRLAGPSVGAADAVPDRSLLAVGSGALAHPDLFGRAAEPAHPDAGWLATGVVAGTIRPEPLRPIYLRPPDVMLGGGGKNVLQQGRSR